MNLLRNHVTSTGSISKESYAYGNEMSRMSQHIEKRSKLEGIFTISILNEDKKYVYYDREMQ